MAFNKMFVMLPVMLAARKLDGEDPNIVYMLRIAYFSVQCCVILLVAYVFVQAGAFKGQDQVIYVPPPETPFADPNAKKKYTKAILGAHIVSTARSLLMSTVFGFCLTTGLHFYKGMVIGLAIQSIMAPFNMYENKLVMAYLLGKPITAQVFSAKLPDELTDDDEVVDEQGNPVSTNVTTNQKKTTAGSTLEEVMLDTWDAGAKADLEPLMSMLNKKNCNTATKEAKWTPLMILSGINAKGCSSAIRQVLEMGGSPAYADVEGWNALHWAAFHGSLDAAKVLRDEKGCIVLAQARDKEGKTPLDLAREEKNDDVAKIIEEVVGDKKDAKPAEEGLRKRK